MSVDKKHLQQNFPFFPLIMEHIYKNVSGDIVLKLYQSCKFFFIKFRPVIATYLRIVDDSIDLDENILTLDEFNKTTKKFILVKNLRLSSTNIAPDNILPCFTECIISHLPNLPINNFKKIVKYTKVLWLMHTKNFFSDDTTAYFEDILSCIPQTYFLYISHSCYFSSKTESLLRLIERKQKFSYLYLAFIEGDIDTAKLYEFIGKNVQPRAHVEVFFINDQY